MRDQQPMRKNEKISAKAVKTFAREDPRIIPFLGDLLAAGFFSNNSGKAMNHDAYGKERVFPEVADFYHGHIESNSRSLNSESYLPISTQIVDLEEQSVNVSVKEIGSKANSDLDIKHNRKKTSSPFPKLGLFPRGNSTNNSLDSFQTPFLFNSHSDRIFYSNRIASEKNTLQIKQSVPTSMSSTSNQNSQEIISNGDIIKSGFQITGSIQPELQIRKCGGILERDGGQVPKQESGPGIYSTHNLTSILHSSQSTGNYTNSSSPGEENQQEVSKNLQNQTSILKALVNMDQQNSLKNQKGHFQDGDFTYSNPRFLKTSSLDTESNLEDDFTEEWETVKTKSCDHSLYLSDVTIDKEAMELRKFEICTRNGKYPYSSYLAEGVKKYAHDKTRNTLALKISPSNLTTDSPYYVGAEEKEGYRKNFNFNEPRDRNSYDFDTVFERAQNTQITSDIAPQLTITNAGDIYKPPLNPTMISEKHRSKLQKFYDLCSKNFSTHNFKKKLQTQNNRHDQKNSREAKIYGDSMSSLCHNRDNSTNTTQSCGDDIYKLPRNHIASDRSFSWYGNKKCRSFDIESKNLTKCDIEDDVYPINCFPKNECIVACYDDGPRAFNHGKSYSISDFGSYSINSQIDSNSDYVTHSFYDSPHRIVSLDRLYGQSKSQREKNMNTTHHEQFNHSSTDLNSPIIMKNILKEKKLRSDVLTSPKYAKTGIKCPKNAYFKDVPCIKTSLMAPLKEEWKLMYTQSELQNLKNGAKPKTILDKNDNRGNTIRQNVVTSGMYSTRHPSSLLGRYNQLDIHKDSEAGFNDRCIYDGKKISILLLGLCITFPLVLFPAYFLGGFDFLISFITNDKITKCDPIQKRWALWAWLPSWFISMALFGLLLKWVFA